GFPLRKTKLDELSVRKRKRVDETEGLARAVGVDVDLVGVTDLEKAPVTDAEPAQPVRSDGLDRPDRRRAVLVFHVEVEPGMRVLPIDFLERADEDDVLGDVELCLDRVVSLRRRAPHAENRQRDEECRLAHSSPPYWVEYGDLPTISMIRNVIDPWLE